MGYESNSYLSSCHNESLLCQNRITRQLNESDHTRKRCYLGLASWAGPNLPFGAYIILTWKNKDEHIRARNRLKRQALKEVKKICVLDHYMDALWIVLKDNIQTHLDRFSGNQPRALTTLSITPYMFNRRILLAVYTLSTKEQKCKKKKNVDFLTSNKRGQCIFRGSVIELWALR